MKIIILCLLLCGCGGKPFPYIETTAAIGDSITLRTGLCLPDDTFQSCDLANRDQKENSYVTYLPNVIINGGRGADTCTEQVAYTNGPWIGQKRGLIGRLNTIIDARPTQVSVLIGINDINSYNISIADVVSCIEEVWNRISIAGIEPIAMTYAQMDDSILHSSKELNSSIRSAAIRNGIRLVDAENIPGYTYQHQTIDGLHPNSVGAKMIADQWMQVVENN